MDKVSEVTVVGAGPAGIAAAIYLKRAGLNPLILDKNEPGGLVRNAYFVENYPGFPKGITGSRLADSFVDQLHAVGLKVTKSNVEHIDVSSDGFNIDTDQGRLKSYAVIIATGTSTKKLSIRGSDLVEGVRLFYEPRSIPMRKRRAKERILVIGGGDIAFDYSLTLLNQGYDVTIVCRSQPKCLSLLYSRVVERGAEVLAQYSPEEIIENQKELILRCRRDDAIKELHTDLILAACGREPNAAFLSQNLRRILDENPRIPETSTPGLYIVGDVVRGQHRQVGIAVGDGIHAAMLVERYIENELVTA